MTNEMHIEGLRGIKPFLQHLMLSANYEGMGEIDAAEIGETIDAAICALEKQIPKKPTTGKYGHTECACCGWIVDSFCGDIEQYPFCPNCGQALDWSDTDDTKTD